MCRHLSSVESLCAVANMGLFNFIFRRMCYTIFRRVDADNSGFIEAIEVEVAIYRLYNIINKRIPGWQDPPSRSQIQVQLLQWQRHAYTLQLCMCSWEGPRQSLPCSRVLLIGCSLPV